MMRPPLGIHCRGNEEILSFVPSLPLPPISSKGFKANGQIGKGENGIFSFPFFVYYPFVFNKIQKLLAPELMVKINLIFDHRIHRPKFMAK
jgi:hypothetical protein